MRHDLKTWPAMFQAVERGDKTHEIRVNDRDYEVGDTLLLWEWNPQSAKGAELTGATCLVEVTFLTPGGEWGLPDDLCVMSIRRTT